MVSSEKILKVFTINNKWIKKRASFLYNRVTVKYKQNQAWIILTLTNILFLTLYATQLTNFATTATTFSNRQVQKQIETSILQQQLEQAQEIDQKIRLAVEQIKESEQENPTATVDGPDLTLPNNQDQAISSTATSKINTHLTNIKLLITSNTCSKSAYQGICQIAQYSYVLPILVALFFLFIQLKSSKDKPFKVFHKFTAYTSTTICTFAIAITLSLYSAHQQAQLQLQQVISDLNGEQSSNLITHTQTLASHLASTSEVPLLINVTSRDHIITTYLSSNHPQQTYVQSQLIPQHYASNNTPISAHFILLSNSTSSDRSQLLINQYDFDDLQTLLPVLSKNIIQYSYGHIGLDQSQSVSFRVLGSVEYQKFHEQKEAEQKALIAEFTAEIRTAISEINQVTAQNTQGIQLINTELEQLERDQIYYVKELEDLYNQYCTNDPNHPDCKELQQTINTNRALIDDYRAQLQTSKSEAEQANQQAAQYKRQFQSELAQLEELLTLIERNPINTQHLLGVYFPASQEILIKFEDGQQDYSQIIAQDATAQDIALAKQLNQLLLQYDPETSFIEYVSTATHEQLHAISFQQEDEWPRFLEEGYTEYLTVQAISPHLTDTHSFGIIGYPHQVIQVQELHQDIDQNQLTQNYFQDKSTQTLEELIKASYPDIEVEDLIFKSEAYFYVGYSDLEARDQLKDEINQLINPESTSSE